MEGASTDRRDDYLFPDTIEQYLDACMKGEVERVTKILDQCRTDAQILLFLKETRQDKKRDKKRTGLGLAFNQGHYEVPAEVVKFIDRSDHKTNVEILSIVFPYVGALQDCDAGVISSLFNNIPEEKHEYILTSKTRWQWTCLMVACAMYDHTQVVQTLLTKLQEHGLLETVLLLQEYDNENTALHWACTKGHVNVAQLILANCEKELKSKIILKQNKYKMSPLHMSCIRNRPESRDKLLEIARSDADLLKKLLMQRDSTGGSIFHLCTIFGATESFKILLQDIEEKSYKRAIHIIENKRKMTVFQSAVHEKQPEMTKMLLKTVDKGDLESIIGKKDKLDRNLLHLSCYFEDETTFQKIMDDLNESALLRLIPDVDRNGNTTLHACCMRGRADMTRMVLNKMSTACVGKIGEFNKFVLAKNNDSQTGLHIGCYQGQKDIIRTVLDSCDESLQAELIKTTDCSGKGPLNIACSRGELELCSELLKYVQMMEDKSEAETCIVKIRDQPDSNQGEREHVESLLHLSCQQPDNRMLQKILDAVKENETTQALLTECDRNGKSAFWKAFEAGDCSKVKIMLETAENSNCVKELVSCTNQQGQTLFHFAFQSQNCSEPCLEMVINNADWNKLGHILNTKDSNRKGHFHFISGARDEILKQAAKADTNGEAFKSYLNNNGFGGEKETVFHKAARNEDHLLLKALSKYLNYLKDAGNLPHDLKGFSDALCKTNKNGQSALHIACQQGKSKVVKILMKIAKQVNCLQRLFRIPDNLKQTFIYHVQDGGKRLLDLLIKEVTDLDMESYEKGGPETDQTTNQTNSKSRWFLTHDLLTDMDKHGKSVLEYVPKEQRQWYSAFLDPFYTHLPNQSANPNANNSANPNDDVRIISHKKFHLFNKPYKSHREKLDSSLLRMMGKAKCTALINHKYVQSYLRACWWQFAYRLYYATLVLYTVLLTSLIALVVTHNAELQTNNDNPTQVVFLATSQHGTSAAKFILFGSTTICFLLQFFLIFAKDEWLIIDNTSDLIINIACLVVSSYSIIFRYELWVHELGLITLIAASVNFLWMLTKIPAFSRQLLRKISLLCIMLFHVMYNVCIFLPIYLILILTFSGTFHMVFQLQDPFSQFGYAIMKTVVMTIGEFEFKDMFFEETEKPLMSYTFSFILLSAFLVIMTISTMNLLISMAVSEIKTLQEDSEVLAFQNLVDRIFESQAVLEPEGAKKIRNIMCGIGNNSNGNNTCVDNGESRKLSQNDKSMRNVYINRQSMSDSSV